MACTIYHNPRCSKSRQTLALLDEHGIQPTIVDYLKAAPSATELDTLLKQLEKEPEDIVRRGEARFKELDLANKTLSREQWLATLSANPILIERPIVVKDGRARLGRPPEHVLELL